jgi:hypothetical protein
METEPTPEAPGTPEAPRRFVSSISLSQPSRRSQAVTWIVLGTVAAAIVAVVLLLYTAGASLWFTH